MDRVAVCMLVYVGDFLPNVRLALESLYSQSYKAVDIYIQEDGNIQKDVHSFLSKELSHDRIKHLGEREENKGIAHSRNDLTSLVFSLGYEYIAIMDADDICMPERLERQVRFMKNNDNIDVCGTYIEEFGDGIEYKKVVTYPLRHKDMLSRFQSRVPIANVTSMFRNSFFNKAGLYPVDNHVNNEDTLMWMKGFMSECKFANIDYIGVKVRVSRSFFNRRNGKEKVWSDLKNRLLVNRNLSFGLMSYLYAILVAVVNTAPPVLENYAYKYLRY